MTSTSWRKDDHYEAHLLNENPARKEDVTAICEYENGERGLTICYSVAEGENLRTLLAAPQMKSDIANFCAAMHSCQTQAEAASIAKDFYALFEQYV